MRVRPRPHLSDQRLPPRLHRVNVARGARNDLKSHRRDASRGERTDATDGRTGCEPVPENYGQPT